MTRPPQRQTPAVTQEDHHKRIRILESIPQLGQGVELSNTNAPIDSNGIVSDWTVVSDPHGYYTNPDSEIVIPEGLAGIYIVSIAFEITSE